MVRPGFTSGQGGKENKIGKRHEPQQAMAGRLWGGAQTDDLHPSSKLTVVGAMNYRTCPFDIEIIQNRKIPVMVAEQRRRGRPKLSICLLPVWR